MNKRRVLCISCLMAIAVASLAVCQPPIFKTMLEALTNTALAQTQDEERKAKVSSPNGLKPVPPDLQIPAPGEQITSAGTLLEGKPVPEHVTYNQVFRHLKELNKEADEEEKKGKDAKHLRKLYKHLAKLDDGHAVILDQVAADTNRDVERLNAKADKIIKKFREKHKGNRKPGDELPAPPDELMLLSQERKQTVLRARDRLRFSIGEEAFGKFNKFVHERVTPNLYQLELKKQAPQQAASQLQKQEQSTASLRRRTRGSGRKSEMQGGGTVQPNLLAPIDECYYDCYDDGCYYAVIYVSSWTWHDGQNVYGYGATELDYCAGLYYDPAVYSRFVEGNFQSENFRLLADGYSEGYADWYPAEVGFRYTRPIGNEYYNTDSVHYVIDYYYGGRRVVARTYHTIRFPPPADECQQGQSFASNGDPCETPTPTPTPTQQARVSYRYSGSGVPLANGTAVGDLPNANFLEIVATGTPAGGTYTWSTNSGLVTLSSNSASTIKVFSKDRKSGSPDDVNIELRYKYGESESVAQIPLTVQQPTTMAYVATRSNGAGAANECTATVRGRRTGGWTKVIDWQVKDQFGNDMQFRMPLSDTINNGFPNSCLAPRKGKGTTLAQGLGTGAGGQWVHTYSLCSTACLRGGNCAVTGYQRYTVNGFVLSNDDKSYTYQCNGISVEGDGSTPPPLTTPARKRTAAFVDHFYMGVVEWQPSDVDLQTLTNRLNTAGGQGQAQLLAEAKALGRALFQSFDYAGRNASDEEFIYNLFYGYYQRAPAPPEHASWLSTLGSYNAQEQNGRELLLQRFETSSEFVNLVYSLELAPVDDPSTDPVGCDPVQEQDCYSNGGSWNPSTCSCNYSYDPCYSNGTYICSN